jgi:hypothetical protein
LNVTPRPYSPEIFEGFKDSEYRCLINGPALVFAELRKMASLIDVITSILALYLSVWVYEIGNWVSLTVSGAKATILMAGILPGGVVGIPAGGTDFGGAKVLQIAICVGAAFVALMLIRMGDLPLTRVTIISIASLYITSTYWEMLSLTAFVPILLHESIYVGLSVATSMVLLAGVGRAAGQNR